MTMIKMVVLKLMSNLNDDDDIADAENGVGGESDDQSKDNGDDIGDGGNEDSGVSHDQSNIVMTTVGIVVVDQSKG